MTEPAPRKSDLGVRVLSAAVMVAVAGAALWLGGWAWISFVTAVALGVLWEWRGLVRGFVNSPVDRRLWNAAGVVYIGTAAATIFLVDSDILGIMLCVVIATDTFAYFSGRLIGGPKIAPSISPSKTWAGLFGGMAGAAIVCWLMVGFMILLVSRINPRSMAAADPLFSVQAVVAGALGALAALIAQAGDFFESWMKRRAGIKDSGSLIPGHGGVFDRVDGLLAVCFAMGVVGVASFVYDVVRTGGIPH